MHQRTLIRKYIVEMMKENIDVGERVFTCRPSPVFLNEAPCIFVQTGSEGVEVESGDKYCAHEYEKTLTVNIDILSLESLDHLDYLGEQVENAFCYDWMLGRRYSDFDISAPTGLSRGVTLASADAYEVDTDSENTAYGQRLTYSVPYIWDNYSKDKLPTWDEYKFDIVRDVS